MFCLKNIQDMTVKMFHMIVEKDDITCVFIQYTYVYKNIIFDDNDNGDNDYNNHIYISVLWMMILIKAMRMVII